jgi:hypothetical protein
VPFLGKLGVSRGEKKLTHEIIIDFLSILRKQVSNNS